jgi:hypothetical protein
MREIKYTCDICGKEFRNWKLKAHEMEVDTFRRLSLPTATVNVNVLFTLTWNHDLCDDCLVNYAPLQNDIKEFWWRK